MKKVLLIIFLIASTSWLAFAQTEKAEGPLMTFESFDHNFGSIIQDETVTHIFTFTNTGTQPIIISDARGSCGCTIPKWPKKPILPGENGEVKVSFNSEGKNGAQDKTVTINSNALNTPVVLHMKGQVELKKVSSD